MSRYAVAYVASLAAFCVLDFLWLAVIARGFYQSQIGALLLERPNWTVAAVFYLLYIVGIQIFAVTPALEHGSWSRALLAGALFGFFAYATYDLTNLATLKGWSASVAAVDIAWGVVVTSLTALAGFAAARAMTS